MLRAIREIKPRWVVGENVRGLINWNGGMVFDEVCTDLEAEGYEVQAYVLPACAVNAPHRRDRVWIVANSNVPGSEKNRATNEGEAKEIWRKKESNVSAKFCHFFSNVRPLVRVFFFSFVWSPWRNKYIPKRYLFYKASPTRVKIRHMTSVEFIKKC